MSCGNYTGNKVVASFNLTAGPSDDPTAILPEDWEKYGKTNSKNLSSSVNTVNVNDDDTGSVDATLAVGEAFEFTTSGFAADADIAASINQTKLKQFYHQRLAAGEQPNCWVQILTPAETIYAHVMITGYSMAGASKEAETIEFTHTATSTCDPDNPAVQYAINA